MRAVNRWLVSLAIASLATGCRGSTNGQARVDPQQGNADYDAHFRTGAATAGCVAPKGDAVSKLIDNTWVDVDPDHPLIPVHFKLPPTLEGKLYSFSPTEVIYIVGPVQPSPEVTAVLQFGADKLQSPEDFANEIKGGGGTVEQEISQGTLGGRPATHSCGTIKVPLPHAVIQDNDRRMREVEAHIDHDRYRGYFIPVDDHVFRASYRISDKDAATWEPIFLAVMNTVTWK